MTNSTFVQRFRDRLRAFRTAERGHVVFTFSLAVIPIIGVIGAAVDYSRANSAKSAMQSAVDATALMLSKDIATLTSAQITQKATAYFTALYNHPEVAGVTITPTYSTTGGSQLVVNGVGTINTTFMKAMGLQSLAVNVSSTIKWGNTRLRVALVLDNTGSMADYNKIGALKTATNNLLTQLKNASAQNGDVYVSIVPFVKDVAVDAVNYNANWINWTDWNAVNGACSMSGFSNQSSCVTQGTCSLSAYPTQSACVQQGTCSKSSHTSQSTCLQSNGIWTVATWTFASWTPKNHNTWNGCITDRGDSTAPSTGNYDTNVTAPTTTIPASLFPAEEYASCPQPVMGLNYNWTAMTTLVSNMTPAGNTNQAIGLSWGWFSLVGGGPFSVPAMDANYTYKQVIILLTDGLNTQDRWYTDQASIDARETMTCANVKAAGITLYTIQVNTGGDPTSTLLRNCASDPSKFFLLTSASAIVTTFASIGTELSNLRVTK
jgi:Flp pilus assembly protein TadG